MVLIAVAVIMTMMIVIVYVAAIKVVGRYRVFVYYLYFTSTTFTSTRIIIVPARGVQPTEKLISLARITLKLSTVQSTTLLLHNLSNRAFLKNNTIGAAHTLYSLRLLYHIPTQKEPVLSSRNNKKA